MPRLSPGLIDPIPRKGVNGCAHASMMRQLQRMLRREGPLQFLFASEARQPLYGIPCKWAARQSSAASGVAVKVPAHQVPFAWRARLPSCEP